MKLDGLLKERYILKQSLGSGGMGDVYKAIDTKENKDVAIKVLVENKETLRRRFSREYRLLQAIDHPHIIKAFDFFEENGNLHIVLEFVLGQSMGELLQNRSLTLSMPEKLSVANKVSRAVELLNRGNILHRDIKPENIMINLQTGTVKLLDLGIGKELEDNFSNLTLNQQVLGTLSYMSPEQGNGYFSKQSDVFSLGVTLYQFFLWNSQSPFYDSNSMMILVNIDELNPKSIYEEVSHRFSLPLAEENLYKKLSQLIMTAMQKAPEKRWQSAKIMADGFNDLQREFLQIENYRKSIKNIGMATMSTVIAPEMLKALLSMDQEIVADRKDYQQLQKKIKVHRQKRYTAKSRKKKALQKTSLIPAVSIFLILTMAIIFFLLERKNSPINSAKKSKEKTSEKFNSEKINKKSNNKKLNTSLEDTVKVLLKLARKGDFLAMVQLIHIYRMPERLAADFEKALVWESKLKKLRDTKTMIAIGNMFLEGKKVRYSPTIAIDWYKKAGQKKDAKAEKLLLNLAMSHGNAKAITALAWLYSRSKRSPKEFLKSTKLYRLAALLGNWNAKKSLADITPKQYQKWMQTVEKGVQKFMVGGISKRRAQLQIKKNNPVGMIYMGNACRYGIEGEKQSWDQAIMWFQKAVNLGSVVAQEYLEMAKSERRGLAPKIKMFQRLENTLSIIDKKAQQGNMTALKTMANIYKYGTIGIPASWPRAMSFYQQAIEKGEIEAMTTLALHYEYGVEVTTSLYKAIKLHLKAVEKGHINAMTRVGFICRQKLKDSKLARKYYLLAAQMGDLHGKKTIAKMLKTGEGGEKSPQQAKYWLNK